VTNRPVNVFVAERGNDFMADIAAWLVEAAELAGHRSQLVRDGSLPTDAAAINLVVAPHEFYVLSDADDAAIDAAARCSIPVCTEQPGTSWFDMTVLLSRASPMVLDINTHGVAALQAAGIEAQHLRLGGVPSMDRRSAGTDRPAGRPTDVLFLGGLTDYRAATLATLAPQLWEHRADLRLFDFSRPVDGTIESLVFGAAKYDLLASSKILVNIHRDAGDAGDAGGAGGAGGAANHYFEWARLIEAMANGCVVVTEPATGCAPLQSGTHFIETTDLATTIAELLNDPERCAEISAAGSIAVLEEHPLVDSLAPILESIPAQNPAANPEQSGRLRRSGTGRAVPSYRSKLRRAQQIPLLPAFRPTTALRRRVYAALHDEMSLQRSIDAARCAYRHGDAEHVEVITSAAYRDATPDATPEVSVIVTLFDYAAVVGETLDSIVASTNVDIEIVIVDDHSNDHGRQVVSDFIEAHPDTPIVLIGVDANRGLPASRNRAIEHARGAKVMVMDADNHVYPSCLRRLADALDAHPGAAFSWSILEEFGKTTGLRSATGWHVPWLCVANHIDAQAMFRAATFEQHGGYRVDDALVFGWEDWEMWLRLAASGERGVHVGEMLGRYRTQETSMLATSNLFGDLMLEHLRELHPTLPWPRP
tara:strand:- start:659 stop:2608 length:1950 start_codon:yes stop_codon:yes gene_type:complete